MPKLTRELYPIIWILKIPQLDIMPWLEMRQLLIEGIANTAVGANALQNLRDGNHNIAIGPESLEANTDGSNNTVVGSNAMESNTTGNNNIAVGYQTGYTNTSGNNNTLIGSQADVISGSLTNATAIGANAIVDASNKIRLGDNNITVIEAKVSLTTSSDRRLKANIVNTKYGLETILKLNPVDYILKSNGLAQIGFIAQDIKPLIPEAVNGKEGILEKGETLGITYSSLIPVLTKAIKEQNVILEKNKEEINTLKSEIEALKKLVQTLIDNQ